MKIPLWSFHVSIIITVNSKNTIRLTNIDKSAANSFLRQKRANKGFFSEIFQAADLQRECQDNSCSTEEFNEVAKKHMSDQDWTEEMKRIYQQRLFDPCARGDYIENGKKINYQKSKKSVTPCYKPSLKECKSDGTNFTCVLYSSWNFIPSCGTKTDQAGRRKICDDTFVHPLTKTCFDELKRSGNLENYLTSSSYEESLELLSTGICENEKCYDEMKNTENWGKCEPAANLHEKFVNDETVKIVVTKECLVSLEKNIHQIINENNFNYTYQTYECYNSQKTQSSNFEICNGGKNIISAACAEELGYENYFSDYETFLSAIFKSAMEKDTCQNEVFQNEGCGSQTHSCDKNQVYSVSDTCFNHISQSSDDVKQYCSNQVRQRELLFRYQDCVAEVVEGIKCIPSEEIKYCNQEEENNNSNVDSRNTNDASDNIDTGGIPPSILPSSDSKNAEQAEFSFWLILLLVVLVAVGIVTYLFYWKRVKLSRFSCFRLQERAVISNKELEHLTPSYS